MRVNLQLTIKDTRRLQQMAKARRRSVTAEVAVAVDRHLKTVDAIGAVGTPVPTPEITGTDQAPF